MNTAPVHHVYTGSIVSSLMLLYKNSSLLHFTKSKEQFIQCFKYIYVGSSSKARHVLLRTMKSDHIYYSLLALCLVLILPYM